MHGVGLRIIQLLDYVQLEQCFIIWNIVSNPLGIDLCVYLGPLRADLYKFGLNI